MAFSVVQSGIIQADSVATGTLASAVGAGDFLYVLVASVAGASGPFTVSVSDNVNGAWTVLDNTAEWLDSTSGVTLGGCFAYVANSAAAAAGALTISVTCTAGQDWLQTLYVDLAGVATASPIVGHAWTTSTTDGDAIVTPGVADANSGDWVIGWAVQHNASTWSNGTGSTVDGFGDRGTVTSSGIYHLNAGSTGGGASDTVNITTNAGAGAGSVNGTVILAAAASAAVGRSQFPHRAPRA